MESLGSHTYQFIIDLRPLIAEYMSNLTARFQEDGIEQSPLTLNGCIGLFPQIYSQPSMTTYDELHDMLAAFHEEKIAESALVIPATGSYNGGKPL